MLDEKLGSEMKTPAPTAITHKAINPTFAMLCLVACAICNTATTFGQDVITVVYARRPTDVLLTVKSVDNSTKIALDSTRVRVAGLIGDFMESYTDDKGETSLLWLKQTTYKIWVDRSGYTSILDTIEIKTQADTLRIQYDLKSI